jgi:hypothetical protein
MMGQYPRKKSGSTSAPPASQRQGLRKQARPASTTYSGQLETAGSGVIETERPRCFLSELGQRQTMIEEIVERASQESERKFYVRLDALEATLTGKLDSLVQAARAAGGTGTVPSVPLEEAQQSAPGSDTGPDTLKVGRVSDWLRERQADRATSSAGTVRGESIVEEVIAAARPRQTPAEIQQAQGLGKQHTQILEQIRRLKRLERDAEERRNRLLEEELTEGDPDPGQWSSNTRQDLVRLRRERDEIRARIEALEQMLPPRELRI